MGIVPTLDANSRKLRGDNASSLALLPEEKARVASLADRRGALTFRSPSAWRVVLQGRLPSEEQFHKLGSMKPPPAPDRTRAGIRLLHTVVWLFFVICIVSIPITTAYNRLGWAAAFSAAVGVECGVLALNRGRCPLTDLAGRYTKSREDNFDIYLPLWLARYNKLIFGTVFVLAELYLLARWLSARPL